VGQQADYDVGLSQADQDVTKGTNRAKQRQGARKVLHACGSVIEGVADVLGAMFP
jgi:hypothetical protein